MFYQIGGSDFDLRANRILVLNIQQIVKAPEQIGLYSEQVLISRQEVHHILMTGDVDLIEQQVEALEESGLSLEQILEAGRKLCLSILGMAGLCVTAQASPAIIDLHIEGRE